MSRQFRYRVTAVVLSGLIFGAPLFTNGTASAHQLDPNDRRVSFGSDGVLGLTCESRPSVESLKVPADSVVQVENRTGHDARLKLGGADKGTVPEGGSAELLFRRGTTAVLLTPECDNGADVVPMLVTAEPSASDRADPTPGPAGGDSSGTLSKPSGSKSDPRTTAGALPGGASSASRPARNRSHSVRSGTRKPSGSRPVTAMRGPNTPAQALPRDAADARLKTRPMPGTGIGAPTFAGPPAGDQNAVVPSAPPVSPAVPRSESAAPPAADVPSRVVDEPVSASATEPIAAVGPIREGRPLGLLGLTALVCILGVATAAIRAIVSQRASHTNMA